MRSILREQRKSSIAAAAITILVGLLLTVWPDRSIDLLCTLLGGAIILAALIHLLGWFSRRKTGVPVYELLPGVILLAVGLWLISRPDSVVRLIQYIFGGILLFHGLVDVQGTFALVRKRVQRSWLDLALSLLTVGLGLLVVLNPFGTFSALVMLMGLSLIFDGVSDLYLIWRLSRALEELDENGSW